jgi:hypothetical protein
MLCRPLLALLLTVIESKKKSLRPSKSCNLSCDARLHVLDTLFSPTQPILPRTGDASLDSFPDLLLITEGRVRLLISTPCARGDVVLRDVHYQMHNADGVSCAKAQTRSLELGTLRYTQKDIERHLFRVTRIPCSELPQY